MRLDPKRVPSLDIVKVACIYMRGQLSRVPSLDGAHQPLYGIVLRNGDAPNDYSSLMSDE